MKKGHFKINLVVICLLMLTLFVACNNNSTPPHEHTYNENEWAKDETHHWHAATCEHTEEVKDKAEHTYDAGKVTKPATTTETGVRTFTCTVCGQTKTEDIPMSGSLQFAPEFSIGKTYDRTPVSISSENIVRDGKALTAEEIDSILFKVKDADDNTYTDEAPTNAGEYTVKITAKATEEHEQSVHIEDFVISPKILSLKIVPTKPYDGNSNVIRVESENLVGVISPDSPSLHVLTKSLYAGSTYKECYIVPSSGGNEKNNYIINEEDTNLKNASITPKKLKLINPITWQYNGKDYMEVTSPGIEGLLSTKDNPTIKVTMTSKNAGATYKSVEVISSENGYEAVNYIVDEEDTNLKNAKITKKPISISETPTKEYDGEREITVKTVGNITGHVSGDMPEIKITMSSKNVGAKYVSHKVSEVGLSESNYTVSESSVADYLKKASITKKTINLPSYSVPAVSSLKQRTFVLGDMHGAIKNETLKVKYQNDIQSWNAGSSFNANSGGRITNIEENKNYSVLMPDESKIKILPTVFTGNNFGDMTFSTGGETKDFTVSNTTEVFRFKAVKIEKTNKSHILLEYKTGENSYAPATLNDSNLTGVANNENILYLHPNGSKGTMLYKCDYDNAVFYLHDLPPGDYKLKVYLY